MPLFFSQFLICFGSLFSVVDPFAALPTFLALVGDHPRAEQSQTALRGALTCWAVLTVFALAGPLVFGFFSLTLPAFKIAGGIVIFLVGLEMMRATPSGTCSTPEERAEAQTKSDVGLIPLGVPLLAGPGSIASVMVLTAKASTLEARGVVHVALLAVAVATFLVLRSAGMMARALGRTGINVITRLMGLILAATAMQFVIDGARDAFPGVLSPRVADAPASSRSTSNGDL